VDPGRPESSDEIVAGSPDAAPRHRPVPRVAGRVGIALGAAAIALSAVGLGPVDLSLHGSPGDRPRPPAPSGPSYDGRASVAPIRLDGIDWPPRGDLVDDERFVRAAMSRVRDFRPGASRLFFAGTLADGSRLVLAGSDVNRGMVATAVHALWIRTGTSVARARVTQGAAMTDPQQVMAWAGPVAGGHVVVVALARPGPVRFDLSEGVTFAADGTGMRQWRPFYAENGLLETSLDYTDPVVAVRARGIGAFTVPFVVRVATGRRPPAVLDVDGADAPGYLGPDPAQLSAALHAAAGAVVDLDRATARIIWSGIPWRHRRLALALVTREDGRRFQVLVGQDDERPFAIGTRALALDADPLTPWLLEPFSSLDPTLLLCPTGPGTLVYSRPGRDDRVLPINAAGVAPLVEPGPSPPSTSGARVTVLDPSGRALLSTVLPETGFDDPLALG
jgi:hypothetical protein